MCMLDHQGQISNTAKAAREPICASTVILYSLAYDAIDVLEDDNLAPALSAQIQVNIALIDKKTNITTNSLG